MIPNGKLLRLKIRTWPAHELFDDVHDAVEWCLKNGVSPFEARSAYVDADPDRLAILARRKDER